jgi:hypothetical protein
MTGRLFSSRPRVSAPSLLIVGFLLLLGAWVGASGPGNGPDEPANYIKAIGAGTGQELGKDGHLATPLFGSDPEAALRIAWINANSRTFRVRAGLTPERFTCDYEPFTIDAPTTCSTRVRQAPQGNDLVSYVGTYPPFVFAVPGVVMARLSNALTAMYVGRMILGLLTAALLTIVVRASWSAGAGPVSLVGPALAVSPMLLFLGTTLGTNGIEVAGAAALFAVVLRSAREDPPRWLWPAGLVASAATTLARPTGLLWLALAVGVALALHGPRGALRAARTGRERLWAALIVLAAVPAVLWDRLVQPHPDIDFGLVRGSISALPGDIRRIGTEWIGVFGWASVRMTPWSYRLWMVLIVLLLVASVSLGRTTRERLLAPAAAVLAVGLAAALDLFIFRQTRFPVYGRYTLPLGLLVPLVAGHVLTLRAGGLPARVRRIAPLAALSAVALVQLIGLWTSARRAAVSVDGPAWFFGRSQFVPPGGWGPWVALALLGTVALAAAGLQQTREDSEVSAGLEQTVNADRQTRSAA